LKPFVLALLAAGLVSAPALAQNNSQIESARKGANCPGCNLFQANFAGLEAKNRNYGGARLRQADMNAVVMNGSNFSNGDLRDVDAYGGVFTGANFAGADLTNATFVGTYLQGARFGGAHLSGANFSGAEMDRAVGLTQAQLSKACGDESTRLPKGLRIPAC